MAVGEISENPSNNAVTRPTVPKTRDEDIERKLRLYGIGQAFSNGKFPSNKQIDVALTSAVQSDMLTKPNKRLSSEGRELIKDLRDVIDSAKYLWLKKNYNEELQYFLYHTIQASTTPDSTNINAPVSKDQAKQHGNDALDGLRTLGRLLVTNGQFRKLLSDAGLLARDMAADAGAKATGKIRPDKERLEKIDEPAPDHTWHEAPPSLGEMKETVNSKAQSAKDRAQDEADGVQRDAAQGATGQSDPREAGKRAADEHANQSNRNDVDQNAGASAGISSAKDRISNAIPDEHKEKAKQVKEDTKNQTKDYLNEKIPEERRDQAIQRLKKMVVEIQQHEDYREAIDTLIGLAEEYAGHAKKITKDTHGEVQRTANDGDLQKAQKELKTLLENFADYTSMDDIFDATDDLISDANNDPEFTNWWKRLDRFIRKCLQQEGYILKDESTEEWNKIQEQGQYFLNDRYKDHTDRVLDEVKRFFDYMANDPDSVAFGNKVQKLFVDLGQDKNGNVKFKKHLLTDVTDVIIPGFFENVRYVPIPRIEVSDPMVDAVVENLVLESENLLPNILEIQADNFFRWGRQRLSSQNIHRFSVHVSQIQCDLKDVAYYMKKKQGFPSIKDTGVMDIFLGGQGLSFTLKLATALPKDRNRIFKVENVNVQIKNLKIVLKKSNHKTLFNLFHPLLMAVAKPAIAKVAEVQIRRTFDKVDEQMWLVQKEYNKAKEQAKDASPEEAQNMLNMYVNAIQKRFAELRKKADEKKPDAKMNVATSKETSLFPNVHLPGGISSKATKYKEMAREGDEWRSPIFDLGSAKTTSNIPKPKQITRKSPHQHTRATINDREGTATQKQGINPEGGLATGSSTSSSSGQQYGGQQYGTGSSFNSRSANTSGYTSLNEGGFHPITGSKGGYIPSSNYGSNGYQPRMSSATDSLSTAVEQEDFEGTHVGKYNVTGSQLPQDPISMPYRDAKDTNVASQNHAPSSTY